MDETATPTISPAPSVSAFDNLVRAGELGFEIFKWFDDQGTDATKAAARTLWLSNAGGLALLLALAQKSLTLNVLASGLIVSATISFAAGIYWGAVPQVTMAHRVNTFQIKVAQLVLKVAQKEMQPEDLTEALLKELPEWQQTNGVLADYLVWAKRALAVGALFGISGFATALIDFHGLISN